MERTANYSEDEKHLLIALVERYKNIIECKETNAISIKSRHDCWESIAKEFNANTSRAPRSAKQIKTLYFNLKRKVKKDVATEHKKEYLHAKTVAAEDKKEIKKTGGGTYYPQLDEAGAQLLAVVAEQIDPLPNPFDDAAVYFADVIDDDMIIPLEPELNSQLLVHPEPEPRPMVQDKPAPRARIIIKKKKQKKQINYKQLYFQQKYEVACFELKSKRILHNLDVKLKKKQLEKLN